MNKVYLMSRLFNLQMSENGSISNHRNEFNMIVSQLNSVDINFEDEIKALILMSSLPSLGILLLLRLAVPMDLRN